MQDVRTTITNSLRQYGLGGYESQAEPVIAACERREVDIVARLRDAGVRIDEVLRDCGFPTQATSGVAFEQQEDAGPAYATPSPVPTAQESSEPRSLEAIVDALSERLDALNNKVDNAMRRAGLTQ